MQFPKMNLETMILVVIFLLLGAWGVKSCRDRKSGLADLPPPTETMANPTLATNSTNNAASSLPNTDAPLVSSNPGGSQYSTTTTRAPRNPGELATDAPATPSGEFTPKGPTASPSNPSIATQPPPRVSVTPAPEVTTTAPTGSRLYVLRQGLQVRANPDLKARSYGRLRQGDEVYYMDDVTSSTTPVRLENGAIVDKPWFKIKTKRGTVGWVHGSGVDFYRRKPDGSL